MNGYKLYTKQPNTIDSRARVYTKSFHIDTNNDFKDRLVRVYIPSTYDFDNPNKRFKVIYMLDGKNLFDDYTSFVGEWEIDESIEDMIEKHINDGYIVVGIDAPNTDLDRSLEMSPKELVREQKHQLPGEGYAHLLGKFIFEVVKPDIDKTFYTQKDYTGVGGSSMGGLMAFDLALKYQNQIKFALAFSPAFFLFKWESFKAYIDKNITSNLPKIYLYVGGVGFEEIFVESTLKTYRYLLDRGFNKDHIKYIHVPSKEHNEKAWKEYFTSMLIEIDN